MNYSLKHIYPFIAIVLLAENLFAIDKNKIEDQTLKAQAKQWLTEQSSSGFTENKGQIIDMEGKPVPFVLFKTSSPGLDMYITTKGLTYLFIKSEEEREGDIASCQKTNELKSEKNKKIEWNRIDMDLKDANIINENIISEGASISVNHYYIDHSPNGVRDVYTYKKITIKDIYPGIDWVLYNSDNKGFKYDFIVQPGANPKKIELIYSTLNPIELNKDGQIEVKTNIGTLTENSPVSFQNSNRIETQFIKTLNKKNCKGGYDTHIQFVLDDYNTEQTLTIDPQLVWGTFYGSTQLDGFTDLDCDSNGNVYVAGYTNSPAYPTQAWGSAYFQGFMGMINSVILVKFSNSGTLIWSTCYGSGWFSLIAYSIDIDLNNNIYLTGMAGGAMKGIAAPGGMIPQSWGSAYVNNTPAGGTFPGGFADIFVIRFSSTGTLTWATRYGGSSDEYGISITTDLNGNIYVTGPTTSADFPTQSWGTAYFDNTLGGSQDAFILRFSNTGILTWATYYGGSTGTMFYQGVYSEFALDIITDYNGSIYLTGGTQSADFPVQPGTGTFTGAYYDNTLSGSINAFILRFSNTGTREWATFYGGTGGDQGISIRADQTGNVYIAGRTTSTDFPTQSWGGAYFSTSGGGTKMFILRFSNTGIRDWATYYGGGGETHEYINDNHILELDNCSNLYLAFETKSSNMPTLDPGCSSFFDGSFAGSWANSSNSLFVGDHFVSKFSSNGQLLWATYLGGSAGDFRICIAIDNNNNLFVAGEWLEYEFNSTAGLPLLNPGGGAYFDNTPNGKDDSFITKFIPDLPVYTLTQVNATGCTCGSATIKISCGTPPYNYRWSNGSQLINTTNTINTIGLCSGNFWVEVTDAACNRDTLYFSISGPNSGLAFTVTHTDPATCTGNGNSTASAAVTGGTSPYNYIWNNGQTTQSATGLAAGNYTVTVTDMNSCTATQTVIITLPAAPTGNSSSTNNGCNSISSASVTVNTGTQPFTYNWSNGQTGTLITNIPAGNYFVTVSDNKGCTLVKTFTITGTNPVSAAFTASPACIGTVVNFTGSTYTGATYSWTISPLTPANVSGATANFSFTFLTAGTYSVYHSVINGGCSNTVTQTITVINCNNPTITATGSSICPGTCATVTASGTGGIVPYTYSWSNGSITQNINPCPSITTTYTVTIKDSNGNTATSMAIVTVNPGVQVTTTSANVTCNGSTNGSATANPGNGTSPYAYSWSNGQITQTTTGLTAGSYSVTITDSKNCTATNSVLIISPPPLAAQFTNGTALCIGCGCKEWILVNATGGTSPYSYSWSAPGGYDKRYKNQLCPGNYNINIKDKNGCSVNVNLTTP